MNALMKEIARETDKIWLNRPADIDKMLARNVDNGKNFSVWVYCYGHAEALANTVYTYYNWGKRRKGDLSTIRAIASDETRRYAGIMKIYYNMTDTSALLEKASNVYAEIENYEDFAAFSQTLQRHLVMISYWVDISIPWDKVSSAFSKIMKEAQS